MRVKAETDEKFTPITVTIVIESSEDKRLLTALLRSNISLPDTLGLNTKDKFELGKLMGDIHSQILGV